MIIDARSYLIKHILQLVLRQRRAFHVFDGTQLLRHPITILLANRLHLLLGQFLADNWVITQIGLGADNETWHTWAVVVDFWEPLFPDVLKGGR